MLFQHGWWYSSSSSFELVRSKYIIVDTPSLQILFRFNCNSECGSELCDSVTHSFACIVVPKPQPDLHFMLSGFHMVSFIQTECSRSLDLAGTRFLDCSCMCDALCLHFDPPRMKFWSSLNVWQIKQNRMETWSVSLTSPTRKLLTWCANQEWSHWSMRHGKTSGCQRQPEQSWHMSAQLACL